MADIRFLQVRLRNGLAESDASQLPASQHKLLSELKNRGFVSFLEAQMDLEPDSGFFLAAGEDPRSSLERIRASTVHLLGLGGVGSVILQHLVGIGIKNYVVIDSDVVESSNFNRQHIYTQADLGQSKTSCCANYIRSRIPESHVEMHNVRITSKQELANLELSPCDLIVSCLDEPVGEIEGIIYDYAKDRSTAAISCGVGLLVGHWGPLQPGCSSLANRISNKPRRVQAKPMRWSSGPDNSILSSMASKDIIKWLAGSKHVISLNRRILIQFESYEIQECVAQ